MFVHDELLTSWISNALIKLKKNTELKNALENCKLLKIVELSPSNVLLKIELENNDEIKISQITKKIYFSSKL